MRTVKQCAALIACLASAVPGISQKAAWIDKEFTAPTPPVQSLEAFLNDTCQPSGLDGIQLLAVQKGHGDSFHLHVSCRQDKAASSRYQVTTPLVHGDLSGSIKTVVDNPRMKLGPFFFGSDRSQDAFVLVEKTK